MKARFRREFANLATITRVLRQVRVSVASRLAEVMLVICDWVFDSNPEDFGRGAWPIAPCSSNHSLSRITVAPSASLLRTTLAI